MNLANLNQAFRNWPNLFSQAFEYVHHYRTSYLPLTLPYGLPSYPRKH
jgi:hypothetical protein